MGIDLIPAHQSPLPTAMTLGYGVYTTFRTPIHPDWLMIHLRRLQQDGAKMGIPIPDTLKALPQWLVERYSTVATEPVEPEVIRLTLLPDVEQFSDIIESASLGANPLLLSTRPVPERAVTLDDPLNLAMVPYVHPFPQIKHQNIGIALHHKRQARQTSDVDDVVWVNPEGLLLESTHGNWFGIRGGALVTADVTKHGCLPGITRYQVVEAARQLNIPIYYSSFPAERIKNLDGAFLTNAVSGIQPVGTMDSYTLDWPDDACDILERLTAQWEEITVHSEPQV